MATALSIVALSISGLTLLWTIGWSVFTHRHATQAKVAVKTSFSIPVYGTQLGDQAIDITATNTGSVTITLTGAQFRIKGKDETLVPIEWVTQTLQHLPVILEPGKYWTGLADLASIRNSLAQRYGRSEGWELRAFLRDASGEAYDGTNWISIGGAD